MLAIKYKLEEAYLRLPLMLLRDGDVMDGPSSRKFKLVSSDNSSICCHKQFWKEIEFHDDLI